jgi:hypothetical protein
MLKIFKSKYIIQTVLLLILFCTNVRVQAGNNFFIKENNDYNYNYNYNYNELTKYVYSLIKVNYNPRFSIIPLNNLPIFSLSSEVIGGECYSDNTNTKKVKFILKNESNSTVRIVGKTSSSLAGNKLQIIRTNLNLGTFSVITPIGLAISSLDPFFFDDVNIDAGQVLEFYLNFNSNDEQTVGSVYTGSLQIVYGPSTSSAAISSNNIIESVTSSVSIRKGTNSPISISKVLNPNELHTLQSAAGITDVDLVNKKFYKNGVLINPKNRLSNNLVLTSSDISGFTYTNVNTTNICQESFPTNISLTLVSNSEIPNGGTIGVNSLEQCFDSTINISNIANAVSSITNVSPLSYSWEMSYDGITWGIAGDSDEGTVTTSDRGAKTFTLTGVTKSFWIRRKVRELLGVNTLRYNYSNVLKININRNRLIFPEGISNTVAVKLNNQTNTGAAFLPVLTASTPNSTIEYRDKLGNVIATNPTSPVSLGNLPLGEYLYEVKAKNTLPGNVVCETVELIKVLVYDATTCSNYTKRTLGTIVKGWTSGLSGYRELENVTNGNRASYGELNGGVVLLGIGTVGMDIYFTKPDGTLYTGAELKGKKVVVKLGEQYSGLKVAGGLSAIGRLTDDGVTAQTVGLLNASNVGASFGVKGGVLDALKGDNVFEFSFTPANSISSNATNIEYNGVRIQLGSLIGVADLATVFYAYIEEEGNLDTDFGSDRQTYCDFVNGEIRVTPPSGMAYPTLQDDIESSMPKLGPISNTNFKLNRSVEDAFWGNYTEVLNVASSLNSVVYPYYAVDDDYDSYSIFNTVVGVLNAKFLQAKLRQKARLGDQVQITLSYPNISVLNLSLLQLGNFKIVYYLNGAVVGEERLEEFRVLDIGLFRFRDKRRAILSKPVNFMFDKVELKEFSAVDVNLGTSLRIHDVRINPLNAFAGMTDPKQVTQLCANSPIVIQKMDPCTEYELSFARVTEFGPAYLIDDSTPMLDYKGQPIRSIYAIQDIPNSTLTFQRLDATGSLAYYSHNRTTLFTGPEYDGKLLIKIQTKRQGCDYGEPQYLRVNLENCIQGSINPVIMNNAKY